jgi:3-hydroxy-9,10-secoandrosta-1,3,5(10)-triene-9,17-dione monooxygenase
MLTPSIQTMSGHSAVPSAGELLRQARGMIPALAARAPEAERQRRIPKETMADLQTAGLFRAIQPRRWGGYELGLDDFSDIQIALAEGDMSTSWVYGNIAGLSGHLALFDDRAARDVWGDDTSTLICCSMMRTGKAIPTEGGFRLTGRWKYVSGCDYCDWVMLGGNVAAEKPSVSDARVFLVPRQDIEFLDTWFVAGLRATGSQDAAVANAFVPEYRTHKLIDYLNCKGPGQQLNTGPLYRLPFGQLFARGPSTGAIGALRGMLNAFIEYGAIRVTVAGGRTAHDPVAQLVCAEAASSIDEAEAILHRNFRNMSAYAERNQLPPLAERMRYKFQSASVAERCSLLAARLFKAAGTAALFDERPFGRFLADINAARQHIANQLETHGRNWGAAMLGVESSSMDFFL